MGSGEWDTSMHGIRIGYCTAVRMGKIPREAVDATVGAVDVRACGESASFSNLPPMRVQNPPSGVDGRAFIGWFCIQVRSQAPNKP